MQELQEQEQLHDTMIDYQIDKAKSSKRNTEEKKSKLKEKKPQNKTVLEGSKVEEIGKNKDPIEGNMEDDSQGKMLEEVVRFPDEEQRRSLAALKRAHKTPEEAKIGEFFEDVFKDRDMIINKAKCEPEL